MLVGGNLSLKHVLLKKIYPQGPRWQVKLSEEAIVAMVTSSLCTFAGAVFPFLDAFAI